MSWVRSQRCYANFKAMSSAFSRITLALIPSKRSKTFTRRKAKLGKAISTSISCDRQDFPQIFSIRRIFTFTSVLNSREKTRHSFLRRTIGPTFSSLSMKNFEPTMKRYSFDLIDKIQQEANNSNGVVDMNDWFNRFSFDVHLLIRALG